jgi:hypothetical protein
MSVSGFVVMVVVALGFLVASNSAAAAYPQCGTSGCLVAREDVRCLGPGCAMAQRLCPANCLAPNSCPVLPSELGTLDCLGGNCRTTTPVIDDCIGPGCFHRRRAHCPSSNCRSLCPHNCRAD